MTRGFAQSSDAVVFHSASFPQHLSDEYKLLSSNLQDVNGNTVTNEGVGVVDNTRNFKYVFYVMYYKPKQSRKQPGANPVKKYVLRKQKFIIGNQGVTDLSSDATANPLVVRSVRTRVGAWLIGHDKFDKVLVAKKGGFLCKQFWQNNLMWGMQDSLEQNYLSTIKNIKEIMPVIKLLDVELKSKAIAKSGVVIDYAARFKKKKPVSEEEQTQPVTSLQ